MSNLHINQNLVNTHLLVSHGEQEEEKVVFILQRSQKMCDKMSKYSVLFFFFFFAIGVMIG